MLQAHTHTFRAGSDIPWCPRRHTLHTCMHWTHVQGGTDVTMKGALTARDGLKHCHRGALTGVSANGTLPLALSAAWVRTAAWVSSASIAVRSPGEMLAMISLDLLSICLFQYAFRA
jgi:hypothetical protein